MGLLRCRFTNFRFQGSSKEGWHNNQTHAAHATRGVHDTVPPSWLESSALTKVHFLVLFFCFCLPSAGAGCAASSAGCWLGPGGQLLRAMLAQVLMACCSLLPFFLRCGCCGCWCWLAEGPTAAEEEEGPPGLTGVRLLPFRGAPSRPGPWRVVLGCEHKNRNRHWLSEWWVDDVCLTL